MYVIRHQQGKELAWLISPDPEQWARKIMLCGSILAANGDLNWNNRRLVD